MPISPLAEILPADKLAEGKVKINDNFEIVRLFSNYLEELIEGLDFELDASQVTFESSDFVSEDVEAALNELFGLIDGVTIPTSYPASSITVEDAEGNFTGGDVEAVLEELSDSVDAVAAGAGSLYMEDDGRTTGFTLPTVDPSSLGSIAIGAGIEIEESESSIAMGEDSSIINQDSGFVLGVNETLRDTGHHSWWFTSQNPGAGFLSYYQTPGRSTRRNDRYPGTLISADGVNNDFVIDLENPENRTIGQITLFIGMEDGNLSDYELSGMRYNYEVIDLDTDTVLRTSSVFPYPHIAEYESNGASGTPNYYINIPILVNVENIRIRLFIGSLFSMDEVTNFNFLFGGNFSVESKPITVAGDLKILSTRTIDKITGDTVSEYYIVLGMSYGSAPGERPGQNSLINSQSSTHSESSRSSIVNSRNSFIGASTDSIVSNSSHSDIEVSHQSVIENSHRAFIYSGLRSRIEDSEHGWIDEGQSCLLRGDGAWISSSVKSVILNGGAVGNNGENWLDLTIQSVIINGVGNWMSPAVRTVIVNGWGNYATGTAIDSAVLTGVSNSVYGASSSVLAGQNNDNQANSAILSGQDNSVYHDDYDVEYFYPTSSAIIGGRDNELTGRHSAILAGKNNTIRYSQDSIFAGDTIRAHHTSIGLPVDTNTLLAVVGSRTVDITNSDRVTVGSTSFATVDNVARSALLGVSSTNFTTPSSVSYATHAGVFSSFDVNVTGSTAGGRLWYTTVLGGRNSTISVTEGGTDNKFFNTVIGSYNVDILDSDYSLILSSSDGAGDRSSITDSLHSSIENSNPGVIVNGYSVKILNDSSSTISDSGYSAIINGYDNELKNEVWYGSIQDSYYSSMEGIYTSQIIASEDVVIENQASASIISSYAGKITATEFSWSSSSNSIIAANEVTIADSEMSAVIASHIDISPSEVISDSSKSAVIASLDSSIYDSDKSAIVGSWLSSVGNAENSSLFGSYSSAIYSYTNGANTYDTMNSSMFGANAGRIVGEYSSNIFGGYINRVERGARWSTILGGYFTHATRPFEVTVQSTGRTTRDDPRSNKILTPENQEFAATTSLVSGSFRSASAASGYLDFTNVKAGNLRNWRDSSNTQIYGIELFNRSTVSFKAYITASNFDEAKDESAYFEVTGAVDVRNGVARILGSIVINTIHSDVGDWDISVDLETIDVTNTWGSSTVAQNQYRIPPVALLRFNCENPTAGTDVIHWYGKVELSNLDF